MLNKIFTLAVLSLLAISSFLAAEMCSEETHWSIRHIGTLSSFDQVYFRECNENGQALIYGRLKGEPYKWAFWDPQLGLISVPSRSFDGLQNNWLRINGEGLVIGVHYRPVPAKDNASYYDLITWSSDQGYKVYPAQFENKVTMKKGEFIPRCRNSHLVVINRQADNSENNRVLVLQNNKLTDLTPTLRKQANSLGYDAGGWLVSDVNSRGMLIGKFCNYEKHPYKDKKLEISTHYFMQDGDKFYVVECPEGGFIGNWSSNSPLWNVYHGFDFDACGRILFYGNGAWIWSPAVGLRKLEISHYIAELAKQESVKEPRVIRLLDDGTIVWLMLYDSCTSEQSKGCYVFENDGNYWFLPFDQKGEPIFKNSDYYPGLKLSKGYHPLFQKNRGFVQVDIIGETHPFMIELEQ